MTTRIAQKKRVTEYRHLQLHKLEADDRIYKYSELIRSCIVQDEDLVIKQSDESYKESLIDWKIEDIELFTDLILEQQDVNYKLLASVMEYNIFNKSYLIDIALKYLDNDEIVKIIFYKIHKTQLALPYRKFKKNLIAKIKLDNKLTNGDSDSEELELDPYEKWINVIKTAFVESDSEDV